MFSGSVNWAAVIISVTTILILLLNNEICKPRLAKFCRIPVPIELIVVISGTLIAKYIPIIDMWKIETIGEIPTGFPGKLPKSDSLAISAIKQNKILKLFADKTLYLVGLFYRAFVIASVRKLLLFF